MAKLVKRIVKAIPTRTTIDLDKVNADIKSIKAKLIANGIPQKLIDNISTRALRTGRRQTGPYPSNRGSRWKMNPNDPQYGTELDCKIIFLKLLGMMLQFHNAPEISRDEKVVLEDYLGGPIAPNTFRDALTRELLDYNAMCDEIVNPKPGVSHFHLGHVDPTAKPKHTPSNIGWRSARSNLLQGDLTLREARTKFVELIARYFELGEVKVSPDHK